MTLFRWPRERRLRRWSLTAGLLLFVALSAVGQQAQKSPSAEQPRLSRDVADEVTADEKVILDALAHPDNIDLIQTAIGKAEYVLKVRAAQQGENWWEAIDARHHLADLRQFSAMAPEQRAALADAWRLNERVTELSQAGKNAEAIELLLRVGNTERQLLGEEHWRYAENRESLGQLYSSVGDFQQATAQLKRLGWSVTGLTERAAVREAAEAVQGPRILQFATHGYILDKPNNDPQGWDNPLLRSMLILAGANNAQQAGSVFYRAGKEILTETQAKARGISEEQMQAERIVLGDGVLTAYEVTGMNLRGTELVNLTACETGLGEVTPDGVAGLRQAFLLAGARSLTMSMWEVPAEETTRQIEDFYNCWLSGSGGAGGRYKAFRAAQFAALARSRQTHGSGHPFYWAGVVFAGDPGDLPSVPATPAVAGKK